MGAEVAAGGGSLPGFLGRKSRYARMDDVLPPDPEDGGGARVRGGGGSSSSRRRYVFACSVFAASLNHVLLGYGKVRASDTSRSLEHSYFKTAPTS